MTIIRYCTIFFVLFFVFADSLYAAPSARSVSRQERNISRQQTRLLRRFERLNAQRQAQVVENRQGKSIDSDADGLPDNLETTDGRCDSDIDDDGILDGDEFTGTPGPGTDFEVHEFISEKGDNTLTAGGLTYEILSNTEFLDADNNPVTFDFFNVGDCVEIEGRLSGTDRLAEKVKSDDDCNP